MKQDNENIASVLDLVQSGLADEEDKGMTLRTVQVALGTRLLESLESTRNGIVQMNNLLENLVTRYRTKVEELLDADSIPAEELFNLISSIQKNQIAFCEMQRRVVQSPAKIFPEDTMSNEEKKLLGLLKSFKTEDEKRKFLSAVESALRETTSNSFDNDAYAEN